MGNRTWVFCDFLLRLIIGHRFTSFPGVPLARGATVVTGWAAPGRGHAGPAYFLSLDPPGRVCCTNRLARVRPRSTTRTGKYRRPRGPRFAGDRGSGKASATRPGRRTGRAPDSCARTNRLLASLVSRPVNSVVFLNDHLVPRAYQDLEFRQHFVLVHGSREEYFYLAIDCRPDSARQAHQRPTGR